MQDLGKRTFNLRCFIKFYTRKLNNISYSSNCSDNNVSMGKVSCRIKSCTSSSIICKTDSAYTIYEIDNSGFDKSRI